MSFTEVDSMLTYRMFANGVSWGYSVYVNEKSVLKFKILIIKIFLFFCHELLINYV